MLAIKSAMASWIGTTMAASSNVLRKVAGKLPATGHGAEIVEREGAVAGHRFESDEHERIEEEDA
ncbi:hypothetical protein [Mesorhizobium sp.]|uniref:hypothetical protein n=1 Tax=Mesorhizobium sp. TaxID=1871066 RepID=UPI00261B98BF|nr:hypothetical protein [Mesorhizobium sp.]